jgi:hypothetical protein
MRWNGDFRGLLLDNTFLLSSKLHSQYTEVGPSQIQRIKQPTLIPVQDPDDEGMKRGTSCSN